MVQRSTAGRRDGGVPCRRRDLARVGLWPAAQRLLKRWLEGVMLQLFAERECISSPG